VAGAEGRWSTVTEGSSPTSEVRGIAREILRYLHVHPEAKDTLDGIAEWWLERQRADSGVVERAVALLLELGAILETRRRGLPPYYQGNPHAPADIDARLGGADEPGNR
jgi:hypothetical protein